MKPKIEREKERIWYKLVTACPLSLSNEGGVDGTSSLGTFTLLFFSFPFLPDDGGLLAASVSHGKASPKARRSDLLPSAGKQKDEKRCLSAMGTTAGADGCAMCGPRTMQAAGEEQRLTWWSPGRTRTISRLVACWPESHAAPIQVGFTSGSGWKDQLMTPLYSKMHCHVPRA
ncbi:uncharacterized protein [Zea mays]|uniref:uncharacterized protein isoform X2 n=1 Tax=Zea mays TaxID=4577 RepID=UPI0009A956C3|nr:uncharacterized protein LOC103654508 isoform X2 [Zea mays]|eukprot:XP_008679559.2 uncharacterized protein LOC103654508 isoform X2 [Zea mays]